jgi:hypothetical protein
MTTSRRIFVRPDIAIPWYHEIAGTLPTQLNFTNQLNVAYVATGKLIDRVISVTPTVYTVTIEWDSIESMNEHYADPITIAHFAERDAYNESNGITNSVSVY